MSDKRFPANIISSTAVEPTGSFEDSSASGTWSLQEAFTYVKAGLWPTAGNARIFVEDVFSTYLYTGNSSTQTITTNVDITADGGMIWFKTRTGTTRPDHIIIDTERPDTGSGYPYLITNSAVAQATTETPFFAGSGYEPTSTGFTLGQTDYANYTGQTYASWTFRKAPRFFDCVSWTGTGMSSIPHNLGVKPACIIFKRSDGNESWIVYHQNLTTPNANWWDNALTLDTTNAAVSVSGGTYLTQEPDENNIYIGSFFNPTNKIYVAYLFAHDPLGPSGDGSDGLIACGSYTGNGSSDGPEIDLGWEPQWLLVKKSDAAADWFMWDNMRGLNASGATDPYLKPNTSAAEDDGGSSADWFAVQATGFKPVIANGNVNGNGNTYIYIAIRRGPMRAPTSGTEVFAPVFGDGSGTPSIKTSFPVDMGMVTNKASGGGTLVGSRMTGAVQLNTSNSNAESSNSFFEFDFQNGWHTWTGINSGYINWNFRRAPGFFDVVAYTGDGVAGRTVPHNLGVAPEMLIFKRRDAVRNWAIVHSGATNRTASQPPVLTGYDVSLNFTVDGGLGGVLNGTAPTADVVTLSSSSDVNISGGTYIAYLFATLPGVSKVGSYTGNGTSQTIDCGFTTGARFILIKRTDSTGDWYVWDSVRGIVAGNDPHLSLNTTAAEVTTDDSVDAESTGFIVNQDAGTNVNVDTASYIFLAIA